MSWGHLLCIVKSHRPNGTVVCIKSFLRFALLHISYITCEIKPWILDRSKVKCMLDLEVNAEQRISCTRYFWILIFIIGSTDICSDKREIYVPSRRNSLYFAVNHFFFLLSSPRRVLRRGSKFRHSNSDGPPVHLSVGPAWKKGRDIASRLKWHSTRDFNKFEKDTW